MKRCRSSLFRRHSDVLECLDGSLSEHGRVLGKAKLKVHFRFIQIAEGVMAVAARNFEAFTKQAERAQRIAVSAAQVL